MIDGCWLFKVDIVVYWYIDMDDFENKLNEIQCYQCCFIVIDGVFSMDGIIVFFDQIILFVKCYYVFVIVDDVYVIGILGDLGGGMSEYFGVCFDIVIGILSKVVGMEGGFVVGLVVFIDFLFNYVRIFIF